MGDVREFRSGWSLARLAEEFGMARATVGKRIRDVGLPPAGRRNGYDVYAIADVAPLLVDALSPVAGVVDPRDLPPKERKDYFQSENERLKAEVTIGTLVHVMEVEADYAALMKQVVKLLDTLPDILERDCAMSPEEVTKVQTSCDRLREQLYDAVTADADPPGEQVADLHLGR